MLTSAPGKLMIVGEYAVLEGATAMVAAIERRVFVRWTDTRSTSALSPEVARSIEVAEGRWGAAPRGIAIDASALQSDGVKLGLGSSAAGAVAAAGAIWSAHHGPIASQEDRQAIFEVALEGHHRVAPGGSGTDVAAASFGGVLSVKRSAAGLVCRPMTWPEGLHMRAVWTGKPARTSAFVDRVQAFRAADGSRYARIIDAMSDTSRDFTDAVSAARLPEILAAADTYAGIMNELGQAAGIEIVTRELAEVREIARSVGGSAKPSGAGGGDVAIALFSRKEHANLFDEACTKRGLSILFAAFDSDGVKSELAT